MTADEDVFVPKHSFRDLTGQTYGQLNVIKPVRSNGRGHIVWRCLCSCGTTRDISSAVIVRVVNPSCGCAERHRYADITGSVSGKLKAVKLSHIKNRKVYWVCSCECGNTAIVRADTIKDKTQGSCGCLGRKANGLAKTTAYGMWYRARMRAAESSLDFSITLDDIVVPDVCPVLGIKLARGIGLGDRSSWPSLDRIDNRLGYVPGNVAVISYRANALKRDASLEEVVAISTWLSKMLNSPVPLPVMKVLKAAQQKEHLQPKAEFLTVNTVAPTSKRAFVLRRNMADHRDFDDVTEMYHSVAQSIVSINGVKTPMIKNGRDANAMLALITGPEFDHIASKFLEMV